MSSSGSDWMPVSEDRTAISSVAVSLLVSISEITATVACVEVEKHCFIEIGSYLYQVSAVVMELQTTKNASTNTTKIFQSLYKNVGLAKELVLKFQKDAKTILNPEVRSALEQLEEVIKQIGEDLSSIPSSSYDEQQYVEIAVRALSKEMKGFDFDLTHFQLPDKKELEPLVLSNAELTKKEAALPETDLYSINAEVSIDSTQSSFIPYLHLVEPYGSSNGRRQSRNSSGSLMSIPQVGQYVEPMPQVGQYVEPLYDTFFCPLTKMIMEEPVTIESGVTYEKKAITEWYEKFENTDDIVCPKTGQKIASRVLNTNMALKATIEEWKERNEVARIKVARSALSLASTDSMIIEALNDLRRICSSKYNNKVQILSMGILPLLAKLLENKDRKVRCATLELLLQLVEGKDDSKEVVAMVVNMSTIVRMLSSNYPPIRHAALLLLLELSRVQSLCKKIGSVTGGILMLITIKYKWSSDAFASQKAIEILRNLEIFTDNIKCMAENGYLEPLLHHLAAGTEEIQTEMASYLGDDVLGHESKTLVAERASPALIKMVHSGNSLTRKAAFQALKHISSNYPNSELLVQAGIVKIMIEEIFTRTIYNEPMNSKNEAAAILANILESGIEIESLQVNSRGHMMISNDILYQIICLLNNSTPDELNINLIRVLLCLAKSPKLSATIVSIIKETDASYNLIELINNPYEELGISAIKLLISLSPYMGHTLADRLCKTNGQPESLIQIPTEAGRITEKHAVSANFLAKLPHQNLTLNLALISKNMVPPVLQIISQIQRSGTRTSRYVSDYLEGLVGILVRFTRTLYDNQVLLLARNYNLTSVFTELLTRTSSNEVERLAAAGLENLSIQSVSLSKIPRDKKPKNNILLFLAKCGSHSSKKYNKISLCPVHRGVCSSQDTFCLLKANAVERLLACLDHENIRVVEAALAAICTLLDDKVDVDKSVSILSEANTVQHVLNVVREHKDEAVWKNSFWVIERFLMKGGDRSASDISQDRLLPAVLVNAFQHGDGNIRQMAESILMHLNKMPNSTTYFTM